MMLRRVSLYYHTVKNMKPGQVINRLRIKFGRSCPLGVSVDENKTTVQMFKSPDRLDFDPVFIARFPVEELMEDKITILHSSKKTDWKTWEFNDRSPLWNFNLHYFEYLNSLVKAWKDTENKKYLDKSVQMIEGWIDNNPKGTDPAWASYTTALRIVIWITYFSHVGDDLDSDFKERFLKSLHEQFSYLVDHLEKDILGNHYFEDLKSLVMASIFFRDESVLTKALCDFKSECREEILSDGMHFELSPMYHKIVFEGMLRVAAALKEVGKRDAEIESYLQPMLDVVYSFEEGLNRIPLFNDSGNNVAKSLDALVSTAKEYFGLEPHIKSRFEDSGFYIFKKIVNDHKWKLIVDAGQPGPEYIPGHVHCDAMSFELFCDGKPVIVNCGTYAYQCRDRSFFRSTAAHNTVMVNGVEQSQCWGVFRLAKRSSTRVLSVSNDSIKMEMTDANGSKCRRTITLKNDSMIVVDESIGAELSVFVHCAGLINIVGTGDVKKTKQVYAPEYGIRQDVVCYRFRDRDRVRHIIS